ncbi:uncharacterized protein LOC112594041 [Melanaphis sacchari]|uniref:uncharacterized protein LOC112594041 n=1 Tax=Melanaphis sacchari TaxID=742174 RepID=UPI000DC14C6A|nr:uncharacterized protein LOC112594041 [Melanaphis sacchari]
MSASRLSFVIVVCFGLAVLSVCDAVPLDDIAFPESLTSRYQSSSWVNYDTAPKRTTRQGSRRPRPPISNVEDPFGGLDPQTSNQGQWSNQRPNQRPNQQQGFNNRPSGQNQWGNPGQNQWGTNGFNPGQNQWGTNGNNPGQSQWGTNGNNPGQNGQNQWGSNSNNPNQNQWGSNGNNPNQNQWGTNGNSPNQNPVQTTTTATNSEQNIEAQRNTCNTRCREMITNEYNPVCGSDSQTYQNRRFLDCVANCGIPTEFSYIGTCVTTTERTNRAT